MKLSRTAYLLPVASILIACESDLTDPQIINVRVEDEAGNVVAEIEPSGVSDTTIEEDVPLTASLVLEFNEPVNLSTAEERITLADTSGGEYTITIQQRLKELTVAPEGMFDPMTNHVLVVDKGIEDTSGQAIDRNLKVNFFTSDM